MESRVVGKIVVALLTAAAWTYYALPRFLQRLLGRGLGRLVQVAGWRSKVIQFNLERAFPEDVAKQKRLYSEAYAHLGENIFEELLLLGPLPRFVRRYVDVEGVDNWQRALAKGKGVLLLSNHIGNWEVMCSSAPLLVGNDVIIVTKRLKPAWLHAAVEAGRVRAGVAATYEPQTIRDILKWIKAKKTVGFILDQYAGPPVGVRVPFFGGPVGTHSVIAMLAKRTGAAVVPVWNYRKPDGRWYVALLPEVEWVPDEHPDREIAINTARYAALVESQIREQPEQWLWVHRRFKGDLGPLRPGEWEEGRQRE